MIIKIILLVIISIVLMILAYFFLIKPGLSGSSTKSTSKANMMLHDILKLSLDYENNNLKDVSLSIVSSLKNYYNIDYCSVFIYENSKLKLLASNVERSYHGNIEGQVNSLINGIKDFKADIKKAEHYLSYASARERRIKFSYFIPLEIGSNILGAIYIENKEIEKLKLKGEFFMLVIENITLVLQSFMFYIRDALTGAYNRNYMNNFLKNHLTDDVYSISIFDIDFFKKFNDTYGHLYGDITLKQVCNYVKGCLDSSDLLFRYGGEEFIIFFDGKTQDEAFMILENIREGFSNLKIVKDGITAEVRCSFGVYQPSTPVEDVSIDSLIKKADAALYKSKENGRNRTTKFSDLQ